MIAKNLQHFIIKQAADTTKDPAFKRYLLALLGGAAAGGGAGWLGHAGMKGVEKGKRRGRSLQQDISDAEEMARYTQDIIDFEASPDTHTDPRLGVRPSSEVSGRQRWNPDDSLQQRLDKSEKFLANAPGIGSATLTGLGEFGEAVNPFDKQNRRDFADSGYMSNSLIAGGLGGLSLQALRDITGL
jgi:hypothetical protein